MTQNRDLTLNKLTNDLQFSNYDLSLVDTLEATRQRLTVKLRLFFREWFLQRDAGLPYYDSMNAKNPDLLILEGQIKRAILSTQRVLEILSFSANFDVETRTLSVSFSARTDDGILNEQISI